MFPSLQVLKEIKETERRNRRAAWKKHKQFKKWKSLFQGFLRKKIGMATYFLKFLRFFKFQPYGCGLSASRNDGMNIVFCWSLDAACFLWVKTLPFSFFSFLSVGELFMSVTLYCCAAVQTSSASSFLTKSQVVLLSFWACATAFFLISWKVGCSNNPPQCRFVLKHASSNTSKP